MIVSVSGWEYPKYITNLSPEPENSIWYFLYLIPVISAILIYQEYKQEKKYRKLLVITLFVPNALFGLMLLSIEINLMDVGFVVSFVCACVLLYREVIKATKITNEQKEALNNTYSSSVESGKKQVKNASEFSKKQAKNASIFFNKNKKYILGVLILVVVCFVAYLIFNKNSYQKAIASLENHKWEEAVYYYDKAYSEMQSGDLELDYDEKQRLDVVRTIAMQMIPVENFRQSFYALETTSIESFTELDKEWTNLPDLNNIPEEAKVLGIDTEGLYSPLKHFSDSFNIALAEMFLPDSIMKDLSVDDELNTNTVKVYQDNIELLLERIYIKSNKTENEKVKQIKRNLAKVLEIDSLQRAKLFKVKYSLTKNKAGYFYKGMPVQDLNKHPYEKITKDEHPADGYFIFEVFENGEKLLELISWYGKEVDEIIVMSSKFKSEDGLCVGMTYEQAKKLGVQTQAANSAYESLLGGSVYFQIPTYSETMLFVLERLKSDDSFCPEGCSYSLPIPANTVIGKIHL